MLPDHYRIRDLGSASGFDGFRRLFTNNNSRKGRYWSTCLLEFGPFDRVAAPEYRADPSDIKFCSLPFSLGFHSRQVPSGSNGRRHRSHILVTFFRQQRRWMCAWGPFLPPEKCPRRPLLSHLALLALFR